MSNLRWVAALLSPRDVGQHGNFDTDGPIDLPTKLADFVSAYRRWSPDRNSRSEDFSGGLPIESALLDLAIAAFSADSMFTATKQLSELLGRATELDESARTVLSVMCSVALAELDQLHLAQQVVADALIALDKSSISASERDLLSAILMQQVNLRRLEASNFDVFDPDLILQVLDRVDVEALPEFPLSVSVGWSSRRTLRNIISALQRAVKTIRYSIRDEVVGDNWSELITSEPPLLSVQAMASAASSYSLWFKDEFGQLAGPDNTVAFGSPRPRDSELWAALMYEEFLGSNHARARRTELAQFRFVQAVRTREAWRFRDALALLRHAENDADVASVVRYLRANGPLVALLADAEQVAQERLSPALLHVADIRVLSGAAEVLPVSVARACLDSVLSALEEDAPRILGRWGARSQRDEALLLCATNLAERTQDEERVWRALLDIATLRNSDISYDLAVARSANRLNWTNCSDTTREEWRAWMLQKQAEQHSNHTDSSNYTLETIEDLLAIPMTETATPFNEGLGVDRVARLVDRVRESHGELTVSQKSETVEIVRPALDSICADARRGAFSGGGISVGALAAILASELGVVQLWPDLQMFLLEPQVQRADSGPAFDVLSRNAAKVPDLTRVAFYEGSSEILARPASGLDSDAVSPFPEALRFLLAASLLTDEDSLRYVNALAFSRRDLGRLGAAKCFIAIAKRESPFPAWVPVTALAASENVQGLVAAHLASALAVMLPRTVAYRDLLSSRLVDLLTLDGVSVPSFALGALKEANAELTPSLRAAITHLSAAHFVPEIRQQARVLLDQLPRGAGVED